MLEHFFRNMPPVVKNLLIINVLMFLASLMLEGNGTSLQEILGLYHFKSPFFQPYQIITYMFMHGGFTHLLFNMFALVMFGSVLERVWGPKRFLLFYFITGIGAVVLYQLIAYFEYLETIKYLDAESLNKIRDIVISPDFNERLSEGIRIDSIYEKTLLQTYYIPMVGASGALFGIMAAFGVLFPNTELMLLFFPVPIKAKYFIPGLMLLELYLGIMQFSGDNVAHFAHLGGALIGYILLKMWQKNRNQFF